MEPRNNNSYKTKKNLAGFYIVSEIPWKGFYAENTSASHSVSKEQGKKDIQVLQAQKYEVWALRAVVSPDRTLRFEGRETTANDNLDPRA